jgi:hypothetical protein
VVFRVRNFINLCQDLLFNGCALLNLIATDDQQCNFFYLPFK